MHSPLFFVKVCVMSSRAGLIIGAPVSAMHWGLLGGKKEVVIYLGDVLIQNKPFYCSLEILPEVFHMIFHCS